MAKKYSTKKALISSLLALVLCFSMLIGTTFAWFTDSVSSTNNIIKAGNLDVEMLWAEGKEDPASATWYDASRGAIFNNDKWEPGYAEVRHVKIANVGSLSLVYKVLIVANGDVSKLADVIDVYYVDPAVQVAGREALANTPKLGTLTEVLAALNETGEGYLASGESDTVTLAFKMQESAGNEYQGLELCDGGFSVQLIATQAGGEFDSFGNDYDKNAAAAIFPGFQGGSAKVGVTLNDEGLTTGVASMDAGDAAAVIPEGVKLADGADSLELIVSLKDTTESNVQLSESEKMRPVDVHIEGVAEDNTTAMLITLKHYLATGLNTGALKLYHVEDGATVAMTQVATPVNHNEFSYDPMTGDVTLALASFSEVAVVADENNPWDGTAATAFSGGSGVEHDPYLIANADQLAYFRNEVDGGNKFDGKYVKLQNNIYLDGVNFDPIGYGYEYAGYTPNGKTFNGTFDGGDNFIFDLKQDGWDLGYSYSMAGGGLFASVVDATIKNVKISGAYIRMECIDMGVLVGYSQGNCTYENIDIYNSKIANYQRSTGGVVGEVTCRRDSSGKPLTEKSTHTFTNVNVHSDVVVGSLWGDFDASCGGVIGGRWDDNNTTYVVMNKVTVRCRLDVYNDITSAYQWHAYRRAGMLIGNTDLAAGENRLAQAPFLTCTDVDVYYGDWVNYTYCSFSNHNERYPWVRTQAGENCTAFSNPRWGVPNDKNGNRVTDMNHEHADGDECNVLRQFAQLYGGGQGVYGQHTHTGVTVKDYAYSITYMNDYKVLDIVYVTDNSQAYTTIGSDQAQKLVVEWATKNIGKENEDFVFKNTWMNAGSTKITEIKAGNDKDIVLYPSFSKPYTARFVDQQGNVIAWCLFHEGTGGRDNLEETRLAAEAALSNPGEQFKLTWEVHINKTDSGYPTYDVNKFVNYKQDVTVYPVYEYTGKLKLTPIDKDGDGIIEHYEVDAVGELDETTTIPGYVNGVPVKVINKLYENDNSWDYGAGVKTVIVEEGVEELARNSLGYTQDLTTVKLPSTLTKLGKNTFSRNLWYNILGDTDTKELHIIYNGTKADWDKVVAESDEDWANGLKKGSTITCTDGKYTATKVGTGVTNHTWTWTSN